MKKCSLCGGRLDRNKRCTLCGLDNTKSDEMYKDLVNQSVCSKEPLTHVHEEPTQIPQKETKLFEKVQSVKKVQSAKPMINTGKVMWAVIFAVIFLVVGLIELISDISSDYYYGGIYEYEEEYDPYEYVIEDMPEDGMSYSNTLSGGQYLVGVDIPMGTYTVTVQGTGDGDISIGDAQNSIYYYEWLDQDGSAEDIRLYEGASFTVSPGLVVSIEAENAQEYNALDVGNFLTEEVKLQDEMVAGIDFPAGVYDIVYTANTEEYDYGNVYWTVTTEEGYEVQRDIFFDTEEKTITYQNVAFPEGTVIWMENIAEESVRLVPSEKVFQTDWYEIYRAF